jgi:nucleoside-diphosphate-sugar epimerase
MACASHVTCPFRPHTKHAWCVRRLMCRAVRRAIIVGNSDGIGLALTRRLMDDGWSVTGLSRSAGPLTDHVVDVTANDYPDVLAALGPAAPIGLALHSSHA